MNNEVKTVSPFKNFCITLGALPTSYLESMSYYETLCWLCKYIENTIDPAINQNAEALKELQTYVATYFDNLDVTQEINDKLDAMAQSGALADVINVEMIGALSDLDTTDKSSIVNAINEVNTKTIVNKNDIEKLNMTDFVTYNVSEGNIYSTENCTVGNGNITVACDSTGAIGKIYGDIDITPTDYNANCYVTIKTNLRPTESFYISPAGYSRNRTTNAINNCYLSLYTDGTVTVQIIASETNDLHNIILFPCLYFMRSFGDQGE